MLVRKCPTLELEMAYDHYFVEGDTFDIVFAALHPHKRVQ